MTEQSSFELFTYSVVQDREERWKETGIPNIFFASFEEAKAEVTRLREDLMASDEEALPPFRIEKIETLPVSKANLLTLLNDGMAAFLKSYEIVETVD
ncbi:hypothetical protein QN219_28285 [Sinorhizobium sp. 7-81]|uniref:hypothetical protein n=1 Tax=Sinorhizobium sp. 8-89 TaxID=3049089 RepID=UPI0024C38B52|nr:hypothetical protein [Sinorhizobium sp. 8-89]MDK1493891.1 hypothetical protein [Sinorhizobium sp. 8-89]